MPVVADTVTAELPGMMYAEPFDTTRIARAVLPSAVVGIATRCELPDDVTVVGAPEREYTPHWSAFSVVMARYRGARDTVITPVAAVSVPVKSTASASPAAKNRSASVVVRPSAWMVFAVPLRL